MTEQANSYDVAALMRGGYLAAALPEFGIDREQFTSPTAPRLRPVMARTDPRLHVTFGQPLFNTKGYGHPLGISARNALTLGRILDRATELMVADLQG